MSNLEISPDPARDMGLLEEIEHDPDVTQATLAAMLGVAVGTVNWYLKRLIAKGYVKVKRAERKKLKYIITPEGIAYRAHLTIDYIEQSMLLYRRTRTKVIELLSEVKRLGIEAVVVTGEGDIADICRLTCLEQGVRVVPEKDAPAWAAGGKLLPAFVFSGARVSLQSEGRDLVEILNAKGDRVHALVQKRKSEG